MTSPLCPEEFSSVMEAFGPFENKPSVAVAVSGGVDSLCLAFLLQEWLRPKGGQLHAVIVDHRLRLESTAQAQATADLLTQHHIPATIISWDGPKPVAGLQQKARAARYHLFVAWCHQHRLRHLFLAHHADDQLETVFMREKRGSHPRGLAGMSACVAQGGVLFLRPLLPFFKPRLQATLRAKKIPWLEDPSNTDLRFTRSQVRRQCLAFSEAEKHKHLLKIQGYGLRRREEEVSARRLLAQTTQFFPEGYVLLSIDLFAQAPLPLQHLALKKLLRGVRGKEKFLKTRQIDFLLQELTRHSLQQGRTLNGCFLKNNGGKLLICREEGGLNAQRRLDHQSPPSFLWDERFLITLKTPLMEPMTLKALGEKGLLLLKKSGYLERHSALPRRVWLSLPALWEEERLLEIFPVNVSFCPQKACFQDGVQIDSVVEKVLFVGGAWDGFFSFAPDFITFD